MAEKSGISWTKSTFNPWIGCTKVSPGCDACYADALDQARMSKSLGGGTKEIPIRHWGAGVPRYRTSPPYWRNPIKWNRQAPESEFAGRKGFWPVFCASLADVFDNEVPEEWRVDLFKLIEATPNLTWLLLTKRIGNAYPYCLPKNVWLGATMVNQEEADRDMRKLLAVPASKHWISYEPALGPVDWIEAVGDARMELGIFNKPRTAQIDWIIVGGESAQEGHVARTFPISWARYTLAQCIAGEVPCFVKQLGDNPLIALNDGFDPKALARGKWDNPSAWPEWLRVQEFPR